MRPNFYVLEYFHHKLANLVAPSTDGRASALQSTSGHLTYSEKPVQTGTKLTKKRVSKFGAVVAPSDAREKNRNIGAQLQSIRYTTAQKDFGKFTSCRL